MFIKYFFKPRLETKEKIENWLKKYNIKNYFINDDLTVDVEENVYLTFCSLRYIPFQFGVVKGSFYCDDNKLKSLEHCPKEIKGSFHCQENNLTSLKYCPKKINGNFYCYNNKLTSLEHCPKDIKGDFDCSNNQLTSLEHSPKEINGDFSCSENLLIRKLLIVFNTIVKGDISSDFGNKEEFLNEVMNQKILKEKYELNKQITPESFQKKYKRL